MFCDGDPINYWMKLDVPKKGGGDESMFIRFYIPVLRVLIMGLCFDPYAHVTFKNELSMAMDQNL